MGVILLYHRIAEIACDPWLLCVSPHRFQEHLDILTRYHRVEPLSEVAGEGFAEADFSRVAITFDDGTIDNLHAAKPLLEQFEVPATFFVNSGFSAGYREHWYDELENLLLQPGLLPKRLELQLGTESFSCDLGESALYSTADFARCAGWLAWEQAPTARHRLYYQLWERLISVSPRTREDVMAQLRFWAGRDVVARDTHRQLNAEEVCLLAAGGLSEIGSHTATHSQLSGLNEALQDEEIRGSKLEIESVTGQEVNSFAYPFGRREDYTAYSVRAVRDAGYKRACSNFAGRVGPDCDVFQLPRFQVQNWDAAEFSRRLADWFNQPVKL